MLLVHVHNTYALERGYIIHILMHDFLGLDTQLLIEERKDVLIEDAANKGRTLRIVDILFQTPENQWLTWDSLPKQPLPIWNIVNNCQHIPMVSNSIPVIYGCNPSQNGLTKSYIVDDKDGLYLGLDIFGSAFFMLTRYEEYVKPDRDQHCRFPASASLSWQEGFLERPIINEYIEILWYCIKTLWPNLERKKHFFKTILSYDVDIPFAQLDTNIAELIRSSGADILKRKSLALALQRANTWQAIKRGDYKQDQNYTFDRIMDISEKNSLKSAFYFKTGCTNPCYDYPYDIGHPYMRQLLRDIFQRGHEIGLHPSYGTYLSLEQIKAEFNKLRQVCDEEGIDQLTWGGRQHFLRWQVPTTWRNWAESGLNYDSTLAYAEQAGFRCGVCYEFQVFDLKQQKKLSLVERPLIIMDVSVTRNKDKWFLESDIFDYMNNLRQICRKYKGYFTLLWHNDNLDTAQMWEIFEGLAGGAYV
ncbi:MAG: polysaccharide deacetylase family protein [Syntrophomonadaceae bacterium]